MLVVTTGLVLQERLQGFSNHKAQVQIVERFAALPLLQPDRDDYIGAAAIRNTCRQAGVQIDTIDALLAQLCICRQLTPHHGQRLHARRQALPASRVASQGASETVMANPSLERTATAWPSTAAPGLSTATPRMAFQRARPAIQPISPRRTRTNP